MLPTSGSTQNSEWQLLGTFYYPGVKCSVLKLLGEIYAKLLALTSSGLSLVNAAEDSGSLCRGFLTQKVRVNGSPPFRPASVSGTAPHIPAEYSLPKACIFYRKTPTIALLLSGPGFRREV